MNKFYLVGLAAAGAIGAIVGYSATIVKSEVKYRKQYDDQVASMARTYEMAIDAAVANVAKNETTVVGGDIVEVTPDDEESFEGVQITPVQNEPVRNQYHKAMEAVETGFDTFVEGGVNDYGVSYIEEEEYLEEDGRFKGRIEVFIDDQNPIFMMDDDVCVDWDRRVGDSIMVDMYKLVPPGLTPVLYVRNHRTSEDYEVELISRDG